MNQPPAVCGLCGEPMPPGETMFKYHGYSGPCPKPPRPVPPAPAADPGDGEGAELRRLAGSVAAEWGYISAGSDPRRKAVDCAYALIATLDRLAAAKARVREVEGQLALWKPLTPTEADMALADAEAVPVSDERIAEMVAYATDPANQLDNSEQAQLRVAVKRLTAQADTRFAAGWAAAVEKIGAWLRKRADMYEKDKEPGPLGFNFWGWRDFAKTLRQAADELASLAPPGAGDGWRPMETAPKDGRTLFLFSSQSQHLGSWDVVSKPGKWIADAEGFECDPTHWQPLPPPPGAAGPTGGRDVTTPEPEPWWVTEAAVWEHVPPDVAVIHARTIGLAQDVWAVEQRRAADAEIAAAFRRQVRWCLIGGLVWLGLLTACVVGVATR